MAVSLDQIFSTSLLNVFVPDTTLEFPPTISTAAWLDKARSSGVERKQAFFDEHLQSLLVIRFKNPDREPPEDQNNPPEILLDLLAHVQVSLEASYISPTAAAPGPETPRTSSALGKSNARLNPHPSILPPSTPHPMPSTGDQDRKYSTAEGTILHAEDSPEAFALLWSEEAQEWMAIYRMAITVCKLPMQPLLCLTVSATLREKPIPTHAKHPLARFFASLGESEINLPTLRLGTVSRQKLFSLPPVLINSPIQPSPSPMTAVRKAHPTLRKSFRKILQTVSGFRVRMRTVFVPYVLLPETEGVIEGLDEEEKERERREAGSEERTVVLCVEIENSGDLGMTAGFMVEKVDVNIGGEGARATLIGWGDHGFSADAAKNTFPLRIGPLAQYNLLYAVTFMRSPEEIDAFSFARVAGGSRPPSDLQRAVTINIFGKPYFPPPSSTRALLLPDPATPLSYPTQTFSSRWNRNNGPERPSADYPSVMPEPASPFPVFAMYSSNTTPGMQPGGSTPQYSATAGSKRFTLVPGANFAGHTLKNLTPNRFLKPSDIGREPSPIPSSRLSNGYPTTPAYPSYPSKSALPPTPMSQRPVASASYGNIGLSVEIRRERGVGAEYGGGASPQTPLPFVSGAFGEQKMLAKLQEASTSGENIVVSVGLLPQISNEQRGGKEAVLGPGQIYPLDVFTLDIFVFNQSLWPRRFEVTCPERRRRRRGGGETGVYDGGSEAARKMGYPGILPLESRIRIGMDFLAVSPGVHSIDTLTLTDVESGFSTNLRSVLDIVVHDPKD
ncbi:TRAPP trafficking subunit Trs65-domain-containing protein [Flammula alnicola]|nr:TRAPP trafficking subunit Trs65-domain-containing protein [Flammula alnicola]